MRPIQCSSGNKIQNNICGAVFLQSRFERFSRKRRTSRNFDAIYLQIRSDSMVSLGSSIAHKGHTFPGWTIFVNVISSLLPLLLKPVFDSEPWLECVNGMMTLCGIDIELPDDTLILLLRTTIIEFEYSFARTLTVVR